MQLAPKLNWRKAKPKVQSLLMGLVRLQHLYITIWEFKNNNNKMVQLDLYAFLVYAF